MTHRFKFHMPDFISCYFVMNTFVINLFTFYVHIYRYTTYCRKVSYYLTDLFPPGDSNINSTC